MGSSRDRRALRWRQWLLLALAAVGGVLYVGSLVGLQQSLVEPATSAADHQTTLLLTREAAPGDDTAPQPEATAARETVDPPRETRRPASASARPTPRSSAAPTLSQTPSERRADVIREQCRRYRDYGIQDELRASKRSFCGSASRETSSYAVYHSKEAGLQGTVATNLWIDLQRAKVHRPIKNIARDGGNHDPRLLYSSVSVRCLCATPQDAQHGVPRVWYDLFARDPSANYTTCNATTLAAETANERQTRTVVSKQANETHAVPLVRRIRQRAIMLARRDDHNPFFQISATLNAWLMLDIIGWRPETMQLVYMDDGFPSPVDELQKALLAPAHDVIPGRDLIGHIVRFDELFLAPFEFGGPMMRHLDDDEPCHANRLVSDFRRRALTALQVPLTKDDPKSCVITVITRRPYQGRMVQRKWRNEDFILDKMRELYANGTYQHGECVFQSVDFVLLPLREQMRIVVNSDVVIGMHGAGMVNVLWTRPGTLVVEIFPRNRKRWGYRNLCQFVGCEWHEFRGGNDVGKGDNGSDKVIAFPQWNRFFDPLFRATVAAMERLVEATL
ncbi:hypothetical protein ATCC90586_004441 [Pythium insidiosum]|nr:hypothetical protein ATCC90586_004441 [Pythium insidiosum]